MKPRTRKGEGRALLVSEEGVLPVQEIRRLVAQGAIESRVAVHDSQFQPNSLDLRLDDRAFRTRCSFLPVADNTTTILRGLTLADYELGPGGIVLEQGCIYLIRLLEHFRLPPDLWGYTNPKSTTGRLDLFARVITETGQAFDFVPPGYSGPLYLEVITRSFPVRLRMGDSLVQLRLMRGQGGPVADATLAEHNDRLPMVFTETGEPIGSNELQIADGIHLSVRLHDDKGGIVGYSAQRNTGVVDLRALNHQAQDYWDPISAPSRRRRFLILEPEEFYIFSSLERVSIPPAMCAEMVPYDPKSGELRTHYAGFFDSGFGNTGGAHVVLEVRNRDTPFLLQHGQRLFRLRYFWNTEEPDSSYGSGLGSHYQGQKLRLAKQFVDQQYLPQDEV